MYRFLVNLCFVALHISSNSVGASPLESEDTMFDSDHLLQFDMPASCRKDNFCFEKDDNYPEKEIKKLLPTLLLIKDRIGTDLTFRDGPEDDPDCPANTTFANKPIYYIRDEKNKVRAVVQSGNFTQIYSAKWCQYPGLITGRDTRHFQKESPILNKFKIECVNMYMNFDFVVLTDEGKAEMVNAKNGIPVCCRCTHSKPGGD